MRIHLATPFLLAFLAGCSGGPEPVTTAPEKKYPQARKGDVVDTYRGKKIPDPYRWLEDADSPETRTWIEAQNAVTLPFLEKIPARAKLVERLTKLWNFER